MQFTLILTDSVCSIQGLVWGKSKTYALVFLDTGQNLFNKTQRRYLWDVDSDLHSSGSAENAGTLNDFGTP